MVSALSGSLEYGLNTMDRAAMTEKDSRSKLIQLKARHKFPWHFPGISQSLGHKKREKQISLVGSQRLRAEQDQKDLSSTCCAYNLCLCGSDPGAEGTNVTYMGLT